MGLTVNREEEQHFVCDAGVGEFRISKTGLTARGVEHFRRGLANGGVLKMAKGGKVPEKRAAKEEQRATWTDGMGNIWTLDEHGEPTKLAPASVAPPPAVSAPSTPLPHGAREILPPPEDSPSAPAAPPPAPPAAVADQKFRLPDGRVFEAVGGQWNPRPAMPGEDVSALQEVPWATAAAVSNLNARHPGGTSHVIEAPSQDRWAYAAPPNQYDTLPQAIGYNPDTGKPAPKDADKQPPPEPRSAPAVAGLPVPAPKPLLAAAAFSRGGKAPGYATGGETAGFVQPDGGVPTYSPQAAADAGPAPVVPVPATPAPAPAMPSGPITTIHRDGTIQVQHFADPAAGASEYVAAHGTPKADDVLPASANNPPTFGYMGRPGETGEQLMSQAQPGVPLGVVPPPGTPRAPGPSELAGAAPAQPQPASASIPSASPFPGSSMIGAGAVLKASKAAEQAQVQLGQTQQQNAAQIAAKQEAAAQEQRGWLQLQQQREAEGRTALRQMFDDLRTSKVDPRHFWADKSTGDRVLLGVSMMLGSIGSAFTGQPNIAAQFIERAIDRDMEAQKANLGKKATVFSYYLNMMQDQRAADMMTRSVLTNIAAAEIDAAATRAGGAAQAQQAQVLASQAHISAIGLANQATSLQTENQFKQYQLRMMQNQWMLMQRMVGGQQGGGPSNYVPSSARPVFTGDIGKWLEASQAQQIDWKDAQGRRLTSHGKPQQAKEAQSALDDLGQIRDDLVELKQLSTQAGAVDATVPWTAVRAKWDALQGHMAEMSPAALGGVKRLNDNELNIGKSESGESIFRNKLNGGAALDATLELIQRRQDAVLRGQGVDERYLGAPQTQPGQEAFPMVRH